jgi:demethylmenaquinone methyltransferase/2-methoxy-6-polyprenyl-1,4-benzoquinol methylase
LTDTAPESKKEQIEKMFDHIAPRYDLANTLFSFGVDKFWRKRLIRELRKIHPANIIDVATGTGKLAALMSKKLNVPVTGIDISEQMLQVAATKYPHISFLKADGENIPFPDASFDALTIAFGIRNFESPVLGLREAIRVLRPGGMIAILEFSKPSRNAWGSLFKFYFRWFIPLAGRLISGHKNAYKYLNQSALTFTSGQQMLDLLSETGFAECRQIRLSGGIATVYVGVRSDYR